MYSKIIRRLWVSFFAFMLFIPIWFIAVSVDLFGLFGDMPPLEELENPKNEVASEVWSADGQLLGKYYYENRTPVTYDSLSENIVNALIATEDARFHSHSGVDFVSMLRVVSGIMTFDLKGGGSTLSQQLAKNLFRTRDEQYKGGLARMSPRSLGRLFEMTTIKTKEWIMAVRIERSYTKKEIMTMYLNTVDFGHNSFGIRVASERYFKKNTKQLTIEEAAVLVGMLKAPTRYSPVSNPQNSLRRRNTVIEQMYKYDFIDEVALDTLKNLPLLVNEGARENDDHNTGLAPYFRSELKAFLLQWCKENGYDLYADGLKIYTTIDSRMQQYAEKAVLKHTQTLQKEFNREWRNANPWIDDNYKEIPNFIEKRQKQTERYRLLKIKYGEDSLKIAAEMNTPVKMKVFTWDTPTFEKDTILSPLDSIRYYKRFLHLGMMAMEPSTGFVKAWVGGINYKHFKYDHVKQGKRQPGSTFKPIVYATAIAEKGFDPCYEVVDAPITFTLPSGGTWTAKNSDGYSGSTLTLRQALARSINTVAAYLIREVGAKEVVKYARNMGITSELIEVPSLCLGPSDVSVYELTGAYSTFVNKGTWVEPLFVVRITDSNGRELKTFRPATREVFSEHTAYTMVHMLKGATEERGGTAGGLYRYKFRQNNEVGGKTGTTSKNSDGWFMGITKDLVVGTWGGGDERSIHFKSTAYGQGAHMSLPAYGEFMDMVFADENLMKELGYSKGAFPKPQGEMEIEFDCSKYGQQSGGNYVLPTRNPDDEE